MGQNQFSFLNKRTEQPLRYIGGELNSISKHGSASILFAFPDIYEIGMSNFGSRILYEQVNYNSPYSMERVYMPWKDVYQELKEKKIPLCSLESGKRFNEFDAIGFSLQHELCFTNVLAMLELGKLEILADKRKCSTIVIAGGGATFNPSSMAKFIDVFAIGDGEELVLDILKVLFEHKDRTNRLNELSRIDGLYVPAIHGTTYKVRKRLLKDINDSPTIEHPLVPYMELIHDRVTYEIQRGCNRGCRFCQAGVIYRPVRQKAPKFIVENINRALDVTGYREVGFLSLNACDYIPLHPLISSLKENIKGKAIYISLPSLRIESIGEDFINTLSTLPKSGFTIAPEAGSARLRAVINKNITEQEILATVGLASELGWSSIKAYFMLGLPTETDEDITEMIQLIFKMKAAIKNKKTKLVASFSNFVPKAHTPFQWEKQISASEFESKLQRLRTQIRDKKIDLKWADPKMSEVEGLLSRADIKVADVIYSAYKKGDIFSSWGGHFDHSKWEKAAKENDVVISDYLSERSTDKILPWANIDVGVNVEWLEQEREKAYSMLPTTHCTFGECSDCGACGKYNTTNKKIDNIEQDALSDLTHSRAAASNDKKYRLRCVYKKTGRFVWLGHFELMNAVEKALLRAHIPVTVSKGFKPSLLLSFSSPIPMGAESYAEIVDIFMSDHVDVKDFLLRINEQLPEEMCFSKADYVPLVISSINQSISSNSWRLYLYDHVLNERSLDMDIDVEVERKGEKRVQRLSDHIKDVGITCSDEAVIMDFEILFTGGKTLKPVEVLKALLPDVDESKVRLIRTGVVLNGISFSY